MTDNEKTRAQILIDEYDEAHLDTNPFITGQLIWGDWYSKHFKDDLNSLYKPCEGVGQGQCSFFCEDYMKGSCIACGSSLEL